MSSFEDFQFLPLFSMFANKCATNPDKDWLVLALESNSWNWDEEISFFKVTEVLFEPEKKEKEG